MKNEVNLAFIVIEKASIMPAYLQIARAIKKAIETGRIKKGEVLPSLSKFCEQVKVSRYVAERSYTYLKQTGFLKSWPGKGYFVSEVIANQQIKVFLLINKLSDYKKVFYDYLVENLGKGVAINLYVYDNDFSLFEKLIHKASNNFTHYVVMAHFNGNYGNEQQLINRLPKHKLIVVGRKIAHISGNYGGIYENFKTDIYQALYKLLKPLSKYHTLKLLLPERHYPGDLIDGFNIFCQDYAFDRQVLMEAELDKICKGEVFICLTDAQLISTIELMKSLGLEAGKDVGIISYNETPLKKFILNGITTISTDFRQMGIEAAHMILCNYRKQMELKCSINLRPSL